jgi:hypothetical protein
MVTLLRFAGISYFESLKLKALELAANDESSDVTASNQVLFPARPHQD